MGNAHECRRDGLDPANSDAGPLQLSMLTVSPSNLSLLLSELPESTPPLAIVPAR